MLNFFKDTQNVFGVLKSEILLHKLAHLRILKTNFVSADGLGNS